MTLKLETEALKFPKCEKPFTNMSQYIANMFPANSFKLDEFFLITYLHFQEYCSFLYLWDFALNYTGDVQQTIYINYFHHKPIWVSSDPYFSDRIYDSVLKGEYGLEKKRILAHFTQRKNFRVFCRTRKIWCTLVSCTICAPNILSRNTKYCEPRLNILQLKLFEFKSITIWNIIRRISLFNLPHVLKIERVNFRLFNICLLHEYSNIAARGNDPRQQR